MDEIDALRAKIKRERKARKEAEALLETKSSALFTAYQELEQVARKLEGVVVERKQEFEEQRRLAEELKVSEGKLRANQTRLNSIMNSVLDAVISIDSDGTIHTYNRAAERIFGFSVTETIGRNISMLMPEPHRSQHDGYIRRYLEELKSSAIGVLREMEGQRKDGSSFPMELAISEMDLDEAQMFVGICRDISRRRERESEKMALEQELRQSQKMESLGTLAGGIAHEINTPVQYVGDNVRFLQDAYGDLAGLLEAYAVLLGEAEGVEPLSEVVQKVKAAAEEADVDYLLEEIPVSSAQTLEGVGRISEIVRAIKEFSHPDAKEKSAIDLNHAIGTTITVTRNQWKYCAELVEDFDESLPLVPCLPGEFNQVVLNLIVNAAHAIEDHGKALGESDGYTGTITVSTKRCDPWVEIRIGDSGTGIAKENQDRIFDPFFTTKEPGRGTGQGLAIAHNIITKKHGGNLSLESELGKGTTFILRLPLEDITLAEEAA